MVFDVNDYNLEKDSTNHEIQKKKRASKLSSISMSCRFVELPLMFIRF